MDKLQKKSGPITLIPSDLQMLLRRLVHHSENNFGLMSQEVVEAVAAYLKFPP